MTILVGALLSYIQDHVPLSSVLIDQSSRPRLAALSSNASLLIKHAKIHASLARVSLLFQWHRLLQEQSLQEYLHSMSF